MSRILTLKSASLAVFRSFHYTKHLSVTTSVSDALQHEQTQSYIHHIGKEPLVYRNVGQHLRLAAEKYLNNEAIVSCHENKRLTYSEVLEKVDRLAASFYQLGLQKGDRIGIWAPNGTQFYLSTLAAARAGMISVVINPAYQVPEIEYALKKVGVKAIIANERYRNQQYYKMLAQLAPELEHCKLGQLNSSRLPSLSAVIIDSDQQNAKLPGAIQFQDLLRLPSETELSTIDALQSKISPDSGVNIQFTSGTTGQPKAALMSHFGFVNNALQISRRNEFDTKDHRICVQTPFFHVFGMVIGIVASMTYGTTMVLPGPGFKAAESLEAIIKERCSVIYGTPTMYVDLVRQLREGSLKLPPIDLAVTGGATCSPKLFLDIQETLGVRQVKTVFGMTEASAVIFQSLFNESKENVLQTVGHLMDHYEAKVVDENGNTVPLGASGELWVRGYGTMLGYWGDELKSKETIGPDRWLRTGDQFQLRQDGYGQIVGRIKEMVIRGGENIYPREIEDFLNTHSKILETHCIGVPDERMGEEICAYVRLRDSSQTMDHAEMKEYCKGKISHFKVPRYLRIVEDFPKTTSGKIQKFKLVEIFKNEVGINPAFQVPEVEYSLNKVGVKALISAERHRKQNYFEMLEHLAPELRSCSTGQLKCSRLPSLKTVIIDSESGNKLQGAISIEELLNLSSEQNTSQIESLQAKISPDCGVNLQFTSGTTGQPKAALMSHYGFVNNGIHIARRNEFDRKPHRICLQVPLFHAYATVIGVTAAMTFGTTIVLPGAGYSPLESIESIVKEKCTTIYGTPTMYVDLTNKVREKKLKLPPVDLAVTGGATCSPKLFMDIMEVLGVHKVKTVFGMTEASAVLFQSLFDDSKENILETVGHMTDHYEAKVVDRDGNTVPFGTAGELWVRGYGTMLGYWEDERRSKEIVDVDRWLRTGDQFVLRPDGYGKIVGRIKEMIIRGGENIFPKEIEDFLNTHPKILETHCIGVSDDRMGEEICAYIRLKEPSQTLDQAEVKEFCKGKIAHFKVPKFVRVVQEYPKTTSGKVQKFMLAEIFQNEMKYEK
ncbi:medium-chain acyl-CoA ligase ACSF2, mitochondrial-like [Sabethes cyaneus]|uniref:medium-chain acyl-CoA ligase ACSF2, mitochondrial-like n=1 Tax=Sabethes cyaneus TaxID=53552 RepID=UPI00237DCE23|nr:medium-chain acyl-CoA ligase ACSF2, mitochondrial-like [Sabethes cyaneus]